MNTIRSRKPTMKTLLSSAILLSFLWWLELNPALAQPAPGPGLPDPNEVPPLGDLQNGHPSAPAARPARHRKPLSRRLRRGVHLEREFSAGAAAGEQGERAGQHHRFG